MKKLKQHAENDAVKLLTDVERAVFIEFHHLHLLHLCAMETYFRALLYISTSIKNK